MTESTLNNNSNHRSSATVTAVKHYFLYGTQPFLSTKPHSYMFFMREATKSKASFNEVTFEAEWFTIDTEARRQVMEVEEVESSLKMIKKLRNW
jgi:hypothetical protein